MRNYQIDVMIIGAQKAGTTSLSKLLSKHPNVCTHQHGEFAFFMNDDYYNNGIHYYWNDYFKDCNINNNKIILAKSVGIMYSEKALKRLSEYNPNMKLILILRNPVERAYSAFWYARRKGWEKKTIFKDAINAGTERFGNDWIAKNTCDYLIRGEYAQHISTIKKYFNKRNIYIYRFDDFKKDEKALCNVIWSELGLTTDLDIKFDNRVFNKSSMPRYMILVRILNNIKSPLWVKRYLPLFNMRKLKKYILKKNEIDFTTPLMKKSDKKYLIKYYKEHNDNLAKITGWNIDSWNT